MRLLYLTCLILLINGCANLTSSLNGGKLSSSEYFTHWETVKEFEYTDSISRREIVNEISQLIKSTSTYRPPNYNNGTSYRDIYVEDGGENIIITFTSGQGKSKNSRYETSSKVYVPFTFEKTFNSTKFSVGAPSKVLEDIRIGALFVAINPVATPDLLANDVAQIIANLDLPPIQRYLSVKKEWKSQYTPSSVSSNFKRLAKCNVTPSIKSQCNLYSVNGYLEVLPYRSGSAVSANYSIQYLVDSDGLNGRDEAERKVSKATERTLAIIND